MERFFGEIEGDKAFLSDEDAHHLVAVLRIRLGEKAEVVDDGILYMVAPTSLKPLVLKALGPGVPLKEPKPSFSLAFPLLKSGHDELLVQKATELGCDAFYPYESSRSVIRVSPSSWPKKAQRLNKIIRGAAMQSKRAHIPPLGDIVPFEKMLSLPFGRKYMAYEAKAGDGDLLSLGDIASSDAHILAVVGPEGGFSAEEAGEASSFGFKLVSLGSSILRAETAGIALMAELSYLREIGR